MKSEPALWTTLTVITLLPSASWGHGGARRPDDVVPDMPTPQRLLVLAPHPDDVMLSAGLILHTLKAGGQVRVVDLTSGDGKNPINIQYVKRSGFRADPNDVINYGYYRQKEDQRAVQHLGLDPGAITVLGYPDGGMWEILQRGNRGDARPVKSANTGATAVPYWTALSPHAPYVMENVVSDIARVMVEFQPDLITMTHPNDHHPDHAATYYYGLKAMELAGLADKQIPIFLPFDIYASDLPKNLKRNYRQKVPQHSIPSPTEWFNLEMTPEEEQAKIDLTVEYSSQYAWEHPFEHNYRGTLSYMFGYVGVNELFGTVTEVHDDPSFRKKITQHLAVSRGVALIGNVFTDFFRRVF